MKKTLFALAALLPLTSGAALADTWTVNPAKSTLGFEVKQAEGSVSGHFVSWQADIDFDPAEPEKAKISAQIETGTAETGNAQYDDMLTQPDYFNSSTAGMATFETKSVKEVSEGEYEAEGTLTIKGIEQPVTLDFHLEIDGDTAHATGKATLQRTQYEIGKSVDTSTLADAVTVTLDLTASR